MANLIQKTKLLTGLLTGTRAHNGPFYVSVDVTRCCNLNCLCCRYHSPLARMPSPGDQAIDMIPVPLFEKLCVELKSLGTPLIILEGEGEPFLHPHLFDLVSTAKKMKFQVMLFTNGMLLNDENLFRLVDTGPDTLKVSLWAASPEEYEKNHPGIDPTEFDRIIAHLSRLIDIRDSKGGDSPQIELCYPINRLNFRKIDEVVDLAKKIKCDGIWFSKLDTIQENFRDFKLAPEQETELSYSLQTIGKRLTKLEIRHNIPQLIREYNMNEDKWLKLPCFIAWYFARLKADGSVFACNRTDLPMGNLNQESFQEIWNGGKYQNFRNEHLSYKNMKMFKQNHCDFGSCIYVQNNLKSHGIFRWFSTLSKRS